MTLARPELLALFWLLPLALWVLWRGEQRRRQRLALVIGRNAAASGVDLRPVRTVVKVTLLLLTLAVLIIALTRPRWGFAWSDVKRHGSDIIIAVDVSQSMLAQDVNPSRIERAKHEILDLLPILKGDRIGLVAFAGDAFVECPLTEDYAAMRMFVSFLGPDLIPLQGTDLKGAINTSMKALFDGSPGGTEGRAIILITDGEDQEPDAEKAAAAAKEKGVKIYALGIGTPDGAPIPDPNGGFKKDAAGNMVVTRPNEKALSQLAASSGGVFARSEAGGGDLERIYVSGIRQHVAQREYQATREKLWFERFQWFVGLAILLLVAEFCLHDVRLTALLLAGFGLFFTSPRAMAGGLAEVYNESVERYRKGDFAAAARGFAAAGDSTDQVLAEASLFNLGNTQVQLSKLDEAIKAYENALALAPKDQQARENLDYVKKLKDQQDKQKDQPKTRLIRIKSSSKTISRHPKVSNIRINQINKIRINQINKIRISPVLSSRVGSRSKSLRIKTKTKRTAAIAPASKIRVRRTPQKINPISNRAAAIWGKIKTRVKMKKLKGRTINQVKTVIIGLKMRGLA